MRLIDADSLHDCMSDNFCEMELITLNNALEMIDEEPTVDTVVLPCKVGDAVYFIKSAFSMVAFPIDAKVVSIRGINCDGEVMYSAITNYNKLDRKFTSVDIGKTVFLTKPEAEQALKEMEGLK